MSDITPNTIHTAECLAFMPQLPAESVHLVVADPPYFRVQLKEMWDNQWADEAAYLDWSLHLSPILEFSCLSNNCRL